MSSIVVLLPGPIAFTGSSGSGAPQGGSASAGVRRPIFDGKAKTHITDPTKDAPEGAAWTLCGPLRPARAGEHRRSVVQEMPRPPTKELKSRDKGPLTHPGSPVIAPLNPRSARPLVSPFLTSQRAVSGLSASGWTLGIPPAPESSEARKSLVSTGLCESGQFSTVKQHTLQRRKYGQTAHSRPLKYGQTALPIQVVKEQVVKEQVVGATILWIKSLKKTPRKGKIKPFLIGKGLKTKDLLHTAVERWKREGNKTQPKPPG